jgi:hypothetical protein
VCLTHKDFRGELSLTKVEAPFYALAVVKQALANPESLPGLSDLISICGSTPDECRHGSGYRRIIDAVGRGDWLLVIDTPISPLSDDAHGLYSRITGKQQRSSCNPDL